jgi:ATP-dependent helicase/nuclease subunit B
VQIRFLLGPSGTGKTFRCLTEIRTALRDSPNGPPLLFLAPKQATFQLERQLLADPHLPGYTRLKILSFDQLAEVLLTEFEKCPPDLLSEEGRLMVLRALLSQKRDHLKLFRSTARLRGFAQQLSDSLRELQRAQVSAEQIVSLADKIGPEDPLNRKLQDLAALLRAYLDWLKQHDLQDNDLLLDLAVAALHRRTQLGAGISSHSLSDRRLHIGGLWFDGFAELAPQEISLLTALLPCCDHATLAFNLDRDSLDGVSWLSTWSAVGMTFRKLHQRLVAQPDTDVHIEWLDRNMSRSRFANNPILQHLEKYWAHPKPYSATQAEPLSEPLVHPSGTISPSDGERPGGKGVQLEFFDRNSVSSSSKLNASQTLVETPGLVKTLRIAICANPEAEATLAAREVLGFVRGGGRFREVAVVVRQLEDYYETIRRIFSRYEIPFFLDRREPVGHHPIAELTRNAIRTIAFGWESEDWFGALKTGLVHANDTEIDHLENEALARGWKGQDWVRPIKIQDEPALAQQLEPLRQRLVRPFQRLAAALATGQAAVLESRSAFNKPTPSPLPGGEPAIGTSNEAPLLGGAGGGFIRKQMEAFRELVSGPALASALREFWQELKVGEQLQEWTAQSGDLAHTTLWEQMHGWLDNLALAFSHESLSLREWLPILEAGLSSQTVGVIPPALDQVLVGAIDRSRNPDLNLAIVLGMNESVFPAAPIAPALLTESDREQLSQLGVDLGPTMRARVGQEQYLGYIACTRSRQRLVLTSAARDENDKALNPSPFLAQLRRLFPTLPVENFSVSQSWLESQHPNDLIGLLLKNLRSANTEALSKLANLAPFAALRERFEYSHTHERSESLSPALAERLYGNTLRTSVSALEEFAACPFKFFVSSGLKADERKLFELDARELGSFQHEILARFHQQLRREGKRWRDLTPREGRERIGTIAAELIPSYREGLFQATDKSSFTARSTTASLQDFIETIIGWMSQYEFDPHAVELAFGIEEKPLPSWELDLGGGHHLSFRGKIDRVDLWRAPNNQEALCVVIDYKSSAKKLDPVLAAHGVQLQLPAYLNVLRALEDPRPIFGVERLIPAGVFYVSLRGNYEGAKTRREAFAASRAARHSAYRHTGRFDGQVLTKLDRRIGVTEGDQFNYRLTDSGRIHGASREVMNAGEFGAMLDSVEGHLKRMGQAIYAGVAKVDPFQKGSEVACAKCDYLSICRIDPWTHQYRILHKTGA